MKTGPFIAIMFSILTTTFACRTTENNQASLANKDSAKKALVDNKAFVACTSPRSNSIDKIEVLIFKKRKDDTEGKYRAKYNVNNEIGEINVVNLTTGTPENGQWDWLFKSDGPDWDKHFSLGMPWLANEEGDEGNTFFVTGGSFKVGSEGKQHHGLTCWGKREP